jgi:hypothetical protein
MRSPIVALTWQHWWRHRLGLAVVLLALVGAAVLFQALPRDRLSPMHGYVCSLWFVVALVYVAAVFTFGFECNLEGRESGFPARLFTLPVRTGVLVGWPMLQGVTAVTLLWVAWAALVLQPTGIDLAWWLQTLLPAACVAVLQALAWLPFGVAWLRVTVAVLLLPFLLLLPQIRPLLNLSEEALVCLYAALIPLGFATAWVGVARARRGDTPAWLAPVLALLSRSERRPLRQRPPFASAARAQLWYEWRRQGLPFPLTVACFVALFLLPCVLNGLNPRAAARVVEFFLYLPLLLAPFVGFALCRPGPSTRHPYPLTSFAATRPVPTAALVMAKVKMIALAALSAWVVVVLVVGVWLLCTGATAEFVDWWRRLLPRAPAWHGWVTAPLALLGMTLLTWRLLTDHLVLGLSGRAWVFLSGMMAYFAGLWLGLIWFGWATRDEERAAAVRAALPWVAGAAVVLKLLAAAWVWRRMLRREMVKPAALAKAAAAWAVAVAGVFLLLFASAPWFDVWYIDRDELLPVFGEIRRLWPTDCLVPWLACVAVLLVPLVRLSAAPLTLAWNRTR